MRGKAQGRHRTLKQKVGHGHGRLHQGLGGPAAEETRRQGGPAGGGAAGEPRARQGPARETPKYKHGKWEAVKEQFRDSLEEQTAAFQTMCDEVRLDAAKAAEAGEQQGALARNHLEARLLDLDARSRQLGQCLEDECQKRILEANARRACLDAAGRQFEDLQASTQGTVAALQALTPAMPPTLAGQEELEPLRKRVEATQGDVELLAGRAAAEMAAAIGDTKRYVEDTVATLGSRCEDLEAALGRRLDERLAEERSARALELAELRRYAEELGRAAGPAGSEASQRTRAGDADATQQSFLALHRPGLMQLPTSDGEFCTGHGILKNEAIGAKTVGLHWEQVHPTGLMKSDDPMNTAAPLARQSEAFDTAHSVKIETQGMEEFHPGQQRMLAKVLSGKTATLGNEASGTSDSDKIEVTNLASSTGDALPPVVRLCGRICGEGVAKKLPLAGTRPASEKQRRLAKRIAEAVGIPMPEGTLEDSRAALRFINNHEGALPPSRKQLSFAEALAQQSGILLPEGCAGAPVAAGASSSSMRQSCPRRRGS